MKFTQPIAILLATSVLAAPVAESVVGYPGGQLTGVDATIQAPAADPAPPASPEAPKTALPKFGGNPLGKLVGGKALNDSRASMASLDAVSLRYRLIIHRPL